MFWWILDMVKARKNSALALCNPAIKKVLWLCSCANKHGSFAVTLWLFNIAMENDPFIDGLPIKNGDFPWLC